MLPHLEEAGPEVLGDTIQQDPDPSTQPIEVEEVRIQQYPDPNLAPKGDEVIKSGVVVVLLFVKKSDLEDEEGVH
ncbi:hypothetical protein CLAVI_000005 [Candidatus Clavichlamydia salmonicola]|uniref:hypothetical protein n=1 Tax=Candidatus Clavichlamydia salmonicola TaxID=469812 RepID=UPI00189138DB|nr:hypothetical protein [Candidatus Clavichlamydia salmonicola]MBF5050404.1 hypothetical protein [Candidatus Clavichlamydia salmonicola]